MRISYRSLIAFAVVVALPFESNQNLAFAPAKGLVLTKKFASRQENSLEEKSIVIDGAKQDSRMPAWEQTTSKSMSVVLVDEYGRIEDGRPTLLKRRYETISFTSDTILSPPMGSDVEMAMTGESSLEGKSVLFTCNSENGEYNVAFAEGPDSDDALLDGLTENTDLRGVLPSRKVAEDDTWEVEPEVLRDVLAFGGALKLDIDTKNGDYLTVADMGGSETMPAMPDEYLGALKGMVTAEYGGKREHEGQQVGIIRLTIEISTEKDMTEFFRKGKPEMPEGTDLPMDINVGRMEFEYQGNAVVLWSLDGGHLVSLDMSGDTKTTLDQNMSMSRPGRGDVEVEVNARFNGSQAISIAVKALDR